MQRFRRAIRVHDSQFYKTNRERRTNMANFPLVFFYSWEFWKLIWNLLKKHSVHQNPHARTAAGLILIPLNSLLVHDFSACFHSQTVTRTARPPRAKWRSPWKNTAKKTSVSGFLFYFRTPDTFWPTMSDAPFLPSLVSTDSLFRG